jgi:exodeoxyribonuclease VII large subunit
MLKMRSFSVSEVNQYIKRMIASDPLMRHIIVEGEISNLTKHSSGHYYFTLKDESGKLSCVMFQSQTSQLTFKIENGDKIAAVGQINLYEREGRYQLYVQDIEKKGLGALHIAFEKLKKAYLEKGYFSKDHKKPLPHLPKRIGVITSPTGAAIKDIIAVYKRRLPLSTLVIYPVRVQGAFSKDEIVKGIAYFNAKKDVDLVIIARGGGSLEELWSFNEAMVAEAIFTSKIPIITGIGHEIDFTIADFVADYRAATPSAAAEIAIISKNEVASLLEAELNKMKRALMRQVTLNQLVIARSEPERLKQFYLRKIETLKQQNARTYETMTRAVEATLSLYRENLTLSKQRLHMLSPLGTLDRGYAVVKHHKQVLGSIEAIEKGDTIEITVRDGEIKATVSEILIKNR